MGTTDRPVFGTNPAQEHQVILVVASQWLMATVTTQGNRVLDVLNDVRTDYLTARNVKVFSPLDPDAEPENVPEFIIPKDRLAFVIIPPRDPKSAGFKRLYARVEKRQATAVALIAGYRITGNLHVARCSENPLYTLNTELGGYFPITDAVVCLGGRTQVPRAVVIVQKSFVDCLYIGDRAELSVTTDV